MAVEEWRADDLLRMTRDQLERGMARAMLYAKGQVQQKINIGNADGSSPSAPGEPPRKVTGRLFQSITTRVTASSSEVLGQYGTNVEYARALELGYSGTDAAGRVRNTAPRPFLRPVLAERKEEIMRILTAG